MQIIILTIDLRNRAIYYFTGFTTRKLRQISTKNTKAIPEKRDANYETLERYLCIINYWHNWKCREQSCFVVNILVTQVKRLWG